MPLSTYSQTSVASAKNTSTTHKLGQLGPQKLLQTSPPRQKVDRADMNPKVPNPTSIRNTHANPSNNFKTPQLIKNQNYLKQVPLT